jgi:hypothetical protein
MFLEDEREQYSRKEVFSQLMKETVLFKFDVGMSKVLQ